MRSSFRLFPDKEHTNKDIPMEIIVEKSDKISLNDDMQTHRINFTANKNINDDEDTSNDFELTDFDLSESKLEEEAAKICVTLRKLQNATYVTTLLDAGQEATDIAMSMVKGGVNNPGTITATVLIKILYSLGLNGDAVKESTDEICDLITKGLPQNWTMDISERKKERLEEWPPLSPTKENIARGIAAVTVSYTVFTDCIGAVYFIKALPGEYPSLNKLPGFAWNILAGIGMGGSLVTSICTKGVDGYKGMRNLLNINNSAISWSKTKVTSFVLGGGFAVIDAGEEVAKTYMTVGGVFNTHGSLGLLGLNLMVAPINVCFSGMVMINGINNFLDYLPHIAKERRENPKIFYQKLFAFAFTLAMAIYLAYYARPLAEVSYHITTDDFKGDKRSITDPTFLVLSWMSFIGEVLLGSFSMYNPMHKIILYMMQRMNLDKDDSLACDPSEKKPFLDPENPDDLPEVNYTPANDADILLAEGLKKYWANINSPTNDSKVEEIIVTQPSHEEKAEGKQLLALSSEDKEAKLLMPAKEIDAKKPEHAKQLTVALSDKITSSAANKANATAYTMVFFPPYIEPADTEQRTTRHQSYRKMTAAK